MLSLILLVAVTPAITSCYYFRHNCSSYFTLSYLKISPTVEGIGSFKADDELACASLCCRHRACTNAVLWKAAKKCSLYNAKETFLREFQTESQEARTGYVMIKKVILPGNLQSERKYDTGAGKKSYADFSPLPDNKTDSWSSCSEILKQNRSKPSGFYNLSDSNVKWTTNCKMQGITGCGGGAWTLVMKVNGSQGTFKYNSFAWSNKATVNKRRETMLPGYWLSPFNKICVQLWFHRFSAKRTLVLNHTAPSLHAAFQQGNNQTMKHDLFLQTGFPSIATTLDNSCLGKGLNVIAPYNTTIFKARIGVFSNESRCPYPNPFFARGLGLGLPMGFPDNITCGDIYLNDRTRITPAFCKIYIQ